MPPRKAQIPLELRLPNEGSQLSTPTTLAIDLRYAQLRIYERWNWERFNRLCKFLNVTTPELASIACIPHNQLQQFQKRNRIMQGQAANRAAALVLTLLEAHVLKGFSNDILEQPFPNLSDTSSTSASSTTGESGRANQGG